MSKKIKRDTIPFNHPTVFKFLNANGDVFTLRGKRFPNRQHDVTHNKKIMFVANVRFVKEVKICLNNSDITTHPFLVCEHHPQDLKPYFEESGFDTVEEWLEALQNYQYRIPKCLTNTFKPFYLHYVYKPSKHPISSIYLQTLKNK